MTLGTMATDSEIRIDFDRLRKDRLAKMNEQLKKDGLGALLSFDPDTIRYVTSTKLNDWTNNKLARCCLLVADQEPVLYEIGSAIEAKKKLSPWIADHDSHLKIIATAQVQLDNDANLRYNKYELSYV